MSNDENRSEHGQGRDALLHAAVRVVARKGLRGLTVRAVALEAGVSHGLVNYYFKSREGLVRESRRFASEQTVGRTLEPDENGLSRLRLRFPSSVADFVDLQAFQFELALEARRDPEFLCEAVELYNSYLHSMSRFLDAAGVDANPALVRLVYAALEGLAFQQLLSNEPTASAESLLELEQLLAPLITAK